MIYTEAEFYSAYFSAARDSRGRKFHKYWDAEVDSVSAGERVSLSLGYHPTQQRAECARRADLVYSLCEYAGKPLTATDVVVVIGGAFNWLGEALEDLVPGLVSYSVDPSPFVQANKNVSPNIYTGKQIENAGYAGTPLGDYLASVFAVLGSWSRSPERVVASLDDIAPLMPVRPIMLSEDCWQIMTDPEKRPYLEFARAAGVDIFHYIAGQWH